MENEIWKDIPGYINKYQVSNCGRVKSMGFPFEWRGTIKTFKSKILSPAYNKVGKGYYQIILKSEKGESKLYGVHQLVMIAFVGFSNGLDVDHINGVPTDNRLENLEYVTHKENVRRYYDTLTNSSSKYVGVSFEKRYNKWHSYSQNNGIKRKHIGYFKCETKAFLERVKYENSLS